MAQSSSDVVLAVNFAKFHNLKVAIKNTGHDYKGRSAAKDSFMIWTHGMVDNLYSESFVPRGCSVPPAKALTFGAGVQFDQAYKFADTNNVTLAGGFAGQVCSQKMSTPSTYLPSILTGRTSWGVGSGCWTRHACAKIWIRR